MVGQMGWSIVFSLASAIVGFVAATYGPLWIGWGASMSAAGMIASVSGLILLAACVLGPHRRGVATPA